jgi:flavodoxin
MDKKILVAYFSHSGNTREIANQIHKNLESNIFEIQAVGPYPNNYNEVVEKAKQELQSDCLPELKTEVEGMGAYEVILIGYPNWWGTIPRPVATFLSKYDFSGKTIIPFCTHEGSGLGRSEKDIAKLCPKATLLKGLAIRGSRINAAKKDVTGWLSKIGVIS